MADERQALFFALFNDGEIGVSRNAFVDLDEISAASLQKIYCLSSFFGRADGDGVVWVRRMGTVDDRTAGDDARPQQAARSDRVAPLEQLLRVAAHVAHARHAVDDEQRKRPFSLLD